MAIKLKNSAIGLGVVIVLYLCAQAFWVSYLARFGDAWRLLLQLI